ncbi:uncharacterized protein LOC118434570 [Folsomia candida]|uniref:Uncharacterized protein n=1 Tax=Folsomia candida TaxID=158441 RepID=A0A226EU74_FOLCA|nr:uncharacterized protein LOC118434570 [Folsomia candida]OXA61079.1 hypothetical protein Fcan01_06289 [Folsomia candida]
MGFKPVISIFLLIAAIQITCHAAPQKGKAKAEAIITKKLKSSTPAQLKQYRMVAAKRMVTDLSKAMQALSTNKDVPLEVQTSAKVALQGIKGGKLTDALANAMPGIMSQASIQVGKPAEQLQTIIGSVLPNSPNDLRNPLQGTLTFLSSNLGGVTNILGKVAGGAPDLLAGTVKSLSGTLGAVADSLNGSVGSLGGLMGGLLNG